MITRIELVNFMSHEHTIIEPSRGLTVLVGPNNCGKSAVVAALQILSHNEPAEYAIRHGAREARIAVTTSEGDEIEWRRKRSGGASYTLNGKLFDRLGRNKVPEEVSRALRLSKVEAPAGSATNDFDLHFGEQKSPVFLLDQQGAPAAQFFASSSDAEKLMRMQSLHKEKVRDAKGRRADRAANIATVDDTLRALEPVEGIEKRVDEAERGFEELQSASEKEAAAERLAAELSRMSQAVAGAGAREEALSFLSKPPVPEETGPLEGLISRLEREELTLRRAEAIDKAAKSLAGPPVPADASSLERLTGELERRGAEAAAAAERAEVFEMLEPVPELADEDGLAQAVGRLTAAAGAAGEAEKALSAAQGELSKAEQAIREWAAEHERCPTCGRPVEADELLRASAGGFGGHAHGT
jgi:exonuclease SbcC